MSKRQNYSTILLALTFAFFSAGSAQATSIFINEIHYDNAGGDTGEAIEISGPAGTNLTGWSILLYNGINGKVYDTINLSGSFANQQKGFGTLAFSQAGIQNGSPDGLALFNGSSVIQFLSYEGSFSAVEGAADGLMSTNIGVFESSSTHVGYSLQLTGSGNDSGDFTWVGAMMNTFGSVNTTQSFTGGNQQPVPEPSTLLFLSSGLTGLGFWRWRQQQ